MLGKSTWWWCPLRHHEVHEKAPVLRRFSAEFQITKRNNLQPTSSFVPNLTLRLSCSFWTTSTGTTGSVRTIFYVCQDVTKNMSDIPRSSITVCRCATCCSQVCCLHYLTTHFRFSAYILTDSFVNCSIRSTHEFDRLLQKHATETGLPVVVDFYR